MLIRTQILLDEDQKLILEKISATEGVSMSELIRQALKQRIKANIINKKEKIQQRQYEAIRKWIKGAVHGPGDSEYDKYAYDL